MVWLVEKQALLQNVSIIIIEIKANCLGFDCLEKSSQQTRRLTFIYMYMTL